MDKKNKELTTPPPASQERGGDGWIQWDGGNSPVPATERVEYRMKNGGEFSDHAGDLYWGRSPDFIAEGAQIIAYRVASPPSSAADLTRHNPIALTPPEKELQRQQFAAEQASSAAEGPKVIDLQAAHLESLRENLRHQDDGMSVFFDDAAEQAKPVGCSHCWGDRWMKDGTPCPACNPSGSSGHAHAEQAQAGESREARMVVVERDNDGKPTVWCDPEIVDLVTALNAAGIRTVASCSGHGEQHGNIALADGRELIIAPNFEAARGMEAQAGELYSEVGEFMCSIGWKDDNDAQWSRLRNNLPQLAVILRRLAGGVTVDDGPASRP